MKDTGEMGADPQSPILTELKAIENDLLWTEKAHFAAAERLSRNNHRLGITATVSAALSALSIVSDLVPAIAAAASVIAAVSSGLLTFLKPKEAAGRHLDAGRDLGALRVRVRHSVVLDIPNETLNTTGALRLKVGEYADAKAAIDKNAPATSEKDFTAAGKKINRGDFKHPAPRRGTVGGSS